MPDIVITIKPDGEAKVHAEGIQGTACSLHTLPYCDDIGIKIGEEALPEMFMDAAQATQQEAQQ